MEPKNHRLSAVLAKAGMTWRQLAKRVYRTPACLHGIATGKNMPATCTDICIGEVLGISANELFDETRTRKAYTLLSCALRFQQQARTSKEDCRE